MATVQNGSNKTLMQVLILLWMVFFGGVVFSGYYLLFNDYRFLAVLAGLFMAALAIVLARTIGNKGKAFTDPLFYLLLIISAVGVASSAFLNFESRAIVKDAIEASQDVLGQTETEARASYSRLGVPRRLAEINTLELALANEIRNPLNCGHGPKVAEYVRDLQALLPGFQPITTPRNDCANNERIIKTYAETIDKLIERASWNNPGLVDVANGAAEQRTRLQALKQQTASAGADTILRTIRPELGKSDDRYRELRTDLARQGGSVATLPAGLPLGAVESLGSSVQLVSLIVSRADRPSTWVYVLLAFFMDWVTVHLFAELASHRSRSTMVSVKPGAPGPAW